MHFYFFIISRVKTLKRTFTDDDDEGDDDHEYSDDDAAMVRGKTPANSNSNGIVASGESKNDILVDAMLEADENGEDVTEAIDWQAILRESNNTAANGLQSRSASRRKSQRSTSINSNTAIVPISPIESASLRLSTKRSTTSTSIPTYSLNAKSSRNANQNHLPAQTYRKSHRSFAILLLRFVGPLVALIIFFGIVGIVSTSFLTKSIATVSLATCAAQRRSCALESIMDIRVSLK